MTFNERAEWERREAIRAARFEAFALRTIEENRVALEAQERLLREKLRRRREAPQLEFSI